jgi:hypothetical protein
MKASIFYRIAAVLLQLFDAGHTSGFLGPIPSGEWILAPCGQLIFTLWGLMGFSRTYWDFYVGFGLFVSVFLLLAVVLAWQLGGPSARVLGTHARHGVGVRPLLCRHHGFELEILFYYSHRFLNRDYRLSDCGGMAFSEAGFRASVAIVS